MILEDVWIEEIILVKCRGVRLVDNRGEVLEKVVRINFFYDKL